MRLAAPRNEAYGDFGLRRRRGLRLGHVGLALGVMLLVVVAGGLGTTQWLARKLAYQPALGRPVTVIGTTPIYAPWASIAWESALRSQPRAAPLLTKTRFAHRATLALAWLAAALSIAKLRRRAENRADELHGSARWAERKDLERAGLLTGQGVVVGCWEDPKARRVRYLRHDGPEHILTFAPTGSGKGVGLVLPTLLSWKHSVLVLDPKGENFALTSGYRAALGHKVYKLDFAADPCDTAAFNPLDAVRIGTAQETADAQRIARMIVDPDGKQFEGPNKHWAETSASLLTGAILHVLYDKRAQGESASLRDVLDTLTDRQRTHLEVLADWETFAHDPTLGQGWSDRDRPTSTHPVVAATAREQRNREERERGAVLSSAVTPLSLFRDEQLALNTSHSDFRIEDLMDAAEPAAVYLVLRPDDIHRLRSVVRILLDLCLRRLVAKMEFAGGQATAAHNHRMLLMLDEFPVLGKLDVFSESLAYIRGWGIKAYLIAQDYEQLRAAYGDRETISSNCHLKNAYAPTKIETAKMLSTLLGNATARRHSRTRGASVGPFSSARMNESEHELARPLLTPDECMRLPGAIKSGSEIVEAGDMLVFAAGHPPIYGKQPLYFQDPTLLARAEHPAAPPRPEAPSEDEDTEQGSTNAPSIPLAAREVLEAPASDDHEPSLASEGTPESEDDAPRDALERTDEPDLQDDDDFEGLLGEALLESDDAPDAQGTQP